MNFQPECPVCRHNNWKALGTKLYQKSSTALSEYVKARYAVLFDIWLPEHDEINISSVVCTNCGFIGYLPRPTADDIDQKYKYLYSLKLVEAEASANLSEDIIRAKMLYNYVTKHLRCKSRVLDFGGGNGRLLTYFLRSGHMCSVVDYAPTPLPGITHAGFSVDELSQDQKFNLIICSHVLEHVVDPRDILRKLARHLEQDGILYIEVPMEIWNRVPLFHEPVTHINFFSAPSLKALLEYSGLDLLELTEDTYYISQNELEFAVKAIAQKRYKTEAIKVDTEGNEAIVRSLIYPTPLQNFIRLYHFPNYGFQQIKRWDRRNIPFFWRFIP